MDDKKYFDALEKFIDDMYIINGSSDEFDACEVASELFKMLRICRVSVTFYNGRRNEIMGRGEDMGFYDSGSPCADTPVTYRFSANGISIIIYEAYPFADSEPWSETELQRIERTAKLLYVFKSRNRILHITKELTFKDDDGYNNVKYFVNYLNQLELQGQLKSKTAVQFNLKHFSIVNQQVGRNSGNLVMFNFVKGLEEIIGESGTICRMGGDNFCMIFPNEISEPIFTYLLGTPVVYDMNTKEKISVSATAGAYVISDTSEDENSAVIMDRIISALLAARNTGEDLVYFDDNMVASKEKMMLVQSNFHEALKNEEFQVYYQPKISLDNKTLAGAEALCRWLRNGKIVPPMEFIPVLEQSMDICRLDFYMLDHVCRDIRRWLDEGRDVVRVSVNLSRKHMMDIYLLERIIGIIDKHKVPHQYIEIELTETTTDVEFKDLKRVVNGLQRAGIYTSVDDFGIGYSSLNLIKEIPWNVVKVDKSFLPDSDNDDENDRRTVMFKYVVAMAREMGLECIAEGVETQMQVELLRQNKCDLAQGFFFDRPLPVTDFEDRLDRRIYDVPQKEE
ncbi:MAG: GGDEF domain-containing protein [Ruminococcus sp.]|nr:GGDEF domain-containing protein [Ruminococcus sp.]